MPPVSISAAHRTRVMNLYRQALRLCMNVTIDRSFFDIEGQKIRNKFDAHKNEPNIKVALQLVEAGEAELKRLEHPDPYKFIYRPGGTSYQRNTPVTPALLENPYAHH